MNVIPCVCTFHTVFTLQPDVAPGEPREILQDFQLKLLAKDLVSFLEGDGFILYTSDNAVL